MNRFFSTLALSGAAVFSSAVLAAPAEPATAVLELVQRHVAAQGAFDVEALKLLTADNYVEVSPVGEVDPREKMLGFYAAENKRPAPTVTVEEPVTRLFGDMAVVIAKLGFKINGPDGKPRSISMRASFVALMSGAGWKLISVQYTGISAPRPPQ